MGIHGHFLRGGSCVSLSKGAQPELAVQHRLCQNVRPVHHLAPYRSQHPADGPPAQHAHCRAVEGGRRQGSPVARPSFVAGGRRSTRRLAAGSVRLGSPPRSMLVLALFGDGWERGDTRKGRMFTVMHGRSRDGFSDSPALASNIFVIRTKIGSLRYA